MLAAQYHLLDYPEKGGGLHYSGFSTFLQISPRAKSRGYKVKKVKPYPESAKSG